MEEQKEENLEINPEAYHAFLERNYGIYHKKEDKDLLKKSNNKEKDEGFSK